MQPTIMVTEDHTQSSSRLSRRQLLAAAASASLTGIAGCGGGDDGTDTTSGSNGDSTDTTSGGNGTGTGVTRPGDADFPAGDAGYDRPDSIGTKPLPTLSEITYPYNELSADEVVNPMPERHRVGGHNFLESNNNPYSASGELVTLHPRKRWAFFELLADGVSNAEFYYPLHAAESFSFPEDNVMEINLKDNLQWWDGKQVTTEALRVRDRLQGYSANGIDYGENLDDYRHIEVVDDTTAQLISTGPLNQAIAGSELTPGGSTGRLTHHPKYWGDEWLTQLEDATTQGEVDSIFADLGETQVGLEKITNDNLGCGLYKPDLDRTTPNEIVATKQEDHRAAGLTNLEEIKLVVVGDAQVRATRLRNNENDIGDQLNQNFEWIDLYNNQNCDARQLAHNLGGGGWNLRIGYNNKHMRRRGVRRAILHAYNHEQVATLTTGLQSPTPGRGAEAGLVPKVHPTFLGQDWIENNLIDYGTGTQVDKINENMQAAGYTKNSNGMWVDSDGDTPTVRTMTWGSSRLTAAEVLSENLSQNGFEANSVAIEGGAAQNAQESRKDEWEVFIHWGAYTSPTDICRYPDVWKGSVLQNTRAVNNDWSPADNIENINVDYGDSERDPIYSRILQPEINPVGDTSLEVSGDTITIRPIVESIRMSRANSLEELVGPARRLTWYCNFDAANVKRVARLGGVSNDDVEFYHGGFEYDNMWNANAMRYLGRGFTTGRDERTRVDDPTSQSAIATPASQDIDIESLYSDI